MKYHECCLCYNLATTGIRLDIKEIGAKYVRVCPDHTNGPNTISEMNTFFQALQINIQVTHWNIRNLVTK